jgi:phage major head subunit gpT-like protein
MATLRTTLPSLYLSRLAFLEDVLFDEMPIEAGVFQRILKVRDMGNKPFVKTTTVASFGQVPIKTEGAAVTYEDLAAGFDVTYQADTYELAFRASKEALDDEQEEVVSDAARALGSSMNYTYDVDHANLFNDGFTSTTGSPDGVSLFSIAHPLVGGGTNQNRPTTDGDLSVAQLRVALNDIANTKDDAGKIVHWRPKILLVSYNQKWLAMELLGSELRADTADNALNAFKDDGLVVVATPYLTDTNAFYLLSEPSKHNVRTYWRERPNVLHDWDFETSSMKVKIRSRWKRGWSDYRGVYGTSGAS